MPEHLPLAEAADKVFALSLEGDTLTRNALIKARSAGLKQSDPKDEAVIDLALVSTNHQCAIDAMVHLVQLLVIGWENQQMQIERLEKALAERAD